jgi:hypothetical protein
MQAFVYCIFTCTIDYSTHFFIVETGTQNHNSSICLIFYWMMAWRDCHFLLRFLEPSKFFTLIFGGSLMLVVYLSCALYLLIIFVQFYLAKRREEK